MLKQISFNMLIGLSLSQQQYAIELDRLSRGHAPSTVFQPTEKSGSPDLIRTNKGVPQSIIYGSDEKIN